MQNVIVPTKDMGLKQKIPSIIDDTQTVEKQLSALSNDNTHPFGLTWIYKIDLQQKNIAFKRLGRLKEYSLSNEDMNDLRNGNWIFTRYHTLEKTDLSSEPMRVGAIILGTRIPGHTHALAWACANQK
jgi:hypothetical protein